MKAYRFVMALFVAGGLILAPLALSPAVAAAKAKTVIVATDATWPPMEMVDAAKNIVGFDIDFLKAVAKEGVNVGLISAGASLVAYHFTVDEADLEKATKAVHEELFGC